jgi:hypothetical protein
LTFFMIGFRTEIRAFGEPPNVLVKKSRSLWLSFCGFGFVLGAPVLIDQATTRPRTGTVKGLRDPVIEVWKPVVLPTAWQVVGHEGVAGEAAPSTITRAAPTASPVARTAASTAASTATASASASLCRRAWA